MIKRIWIIGMIALLCAVFLMPSMVGAEPIVVWEGEVNLNGGTFEYIPAANQSASYEWESLTDLGALWAASESGEFEFNTSDLNPTFGSFYINSINGTANEGEYSWSILINGETTWSGLGLNNLNEGDYVTFCYLKWIEETPGNWVPDVENATQIVNITVNDVTVVWEGEVNLNGGTFDYIPAANQSASYEWESLTDLGALWAASESGEFEFNTSDLNPTFGSFYINSINGTANEGEYSWSILINGETTWSGLGLNNLNEGDYVTFCYLKWIEETPGNWVPDVENATQIVNITVNDVTVVWEGEVNLNGGTFDYIPAANQSASYEWESLTDLGALWAASESGEFEFNTSDLNPTFGSFYINSINGTANEGEYSWSILINGETTWSGLGLNNLNDGDYVTFCYLKWIEETPGNWVPDVENATQVVNIIISESTARSKSSGGGTGQATIVKLVDEEQPTTPEETPVVDDTPAVKEETKDEPQSAGMTEPVIETNVETEEEQNSTPGFEAAFAVSGLLLSAVFIMRRRM
ncbi:DUF4430 domain-containing protein [Methanococcoides methylutens]|uniref:DUF4430 domain-containing protein n=1 Tax=Methanococcoides methylutens TaxID=2226 RepID=UPI004044FEAB